MIGWCLASANHSQAFCQRLLFESLNFSISNTSPCSAASHYLNQCYYPLGTEFSVKFESKYNKIISRNCIRKCCLQMSAIVLWVRCVNRPFNRGIYSISVNSSWVFLEWSRAHPAYWCIHMTAKLWFLLDVYLCLEHVSPICSFSQVVTSLAWLDNLTVFDI